MLCAKFDSFADNNRESAILCYLMTYNIVLSYFYTVYDYIYCQYYGLGDMLILCLLIHKLDNI